MIDANLADRPECGATNPLKIDAFEPQKSIQGTAVHEGVYYGAVDVVQCTFAL